MEIFVVFIASVFCCAFGTLVGGNSLITIPLLMLLGLPPHTAVGTDRVGVLGLGLAGLWTFHRKGLMRYRLALMVGLPSMLGAVAGSFVAFQISPELLRRLIVALTVILLVVVATRRGLGVTEGAERPLTWGRVLLGACLSLLVGVYNGIYGAGGGTFLAYIMLLVFRLTFLESAANLKVATVLSFIVSTAIYAYHGAIHYPFAAAMFVGAGLGSFLGAHYSDRIGNVWLKRVFIGIVLAMAVKLLLNP